MPYKVVGKCVHKLNADGSVGAVVPGGCHDTTEQASAHARALYANVEDAKTKALSNTIRQILEAKIHDSFTSAADQLAMRGYLSRDERIGLSGNIGDILGKFGESIAQVVANKIVNPDDVHCIASKEVSAIASSTGLHGPNSLLGIEGIESSRKKRVEVKAMSDHSGFLVSSKDGDHLPTRKNGKLDHGLMGAAWAALHGGYRGNKYEGPNKSEAISKLTALYKSEGMPTPGEEKSKTKGIDPYSALSQFKQADGKWRWVLTTSSGFSDRDGETIPTSLLAQDSIRMKETGDYGPLRWQHVGSERADPKTRDPGKGLDIGLCDFSDMHGHTQVESGTYLHEAIGDAFQKQLKALGGSKGYFYASMDPDANGIYRKPIWGFERSILPRESASNWMATALKHLLHKEADVNETAVKALKDKLGPDNAHLVDELLKGIEQKEETLIQAGVGVKAMNLPVPVVNVNPAPTLPITAESEVEATGAKAKKEHPDEEKGEMMMETPADEKDEEKKKTKEAEVSALTLHTTAELVASVSDAIALKMKDAFITPAMLEASLTAKFAELTAVRTKEADETRSTLKSLSDRLAVLEGETPDSKKGLKASSSAATVVDHPLMRAALEQLANSQGLTEVLGLKETPQDDFTRLAKRMTASLPNTGTNG